MLLFTLFLICAKIICFLMRVLNETMPDQQIFSNIKKRCCDVFCAPELKFSSPPTPVWIS